MSGIIGKNANRSSGVIGTAGAGIASLAADSSPQLGGFLDANGNYIQMEKGGDIASASPTVIDTDGDFFAVTGTTNFSAFTVAADRHFFLEFGGALTMTHGAGTLDLPGAANITTAASDVGEFVSTAANVVTCVNYTKRDGTAVVAAAGGEDGLTNNSNTTWMVVSSDEEVTMPKQVSVLCSGPNVAAVNGITGSAAIYTIIWGTPTYDQNSDMSSTTTFTAPVTGKYLIICSLHINAVTSAADSVAMYVTTSNDQFFYSDNQVNGFGTEFETRLSIVCDMDADDTLTVQTQVNGEANDTIVNLTAGNNGYTYLSVCLLH